MLDELTQALTDELAWGFLNLDGVFTNIRETNYILVLLQD